VSAPSDEPSRSRWAALWDLDPEVAYLNHGSFGACPRAVVERQQALRQELEREPVDFIVRRLPARLAAARQALGAFVGADPDDLAFVSNATEGVNTVLRSLRLAPGDELLVTDHGYGACRKAAEHVAALTGARVVAAAVPFPLSSADEVVAPVVAAVTPRTRLALLDHVTSPTALVFPLPQLVPALRARGVDALVDGAHALGMVPLDLRRLGAAYYTANAHKWLCAPRGSAFLHVRRDRQAGLHPLVISHGYEPGSDEVRFRDEFDWTGTRDPTPWLVIPDCLSHLAVQLPGGWPALMERNRSLALAARGILCEALELRAPAPAAMIGSIASIPLPRPVAGAPAGGQGAEALTSWFRERGVETWLYHWPSPAQMVIRVSAQLYNHEDQYRALASRLREALGIG
jgi:isopenicillin-N epimerase